MRTLIGDIKDQEGQEIEMAGFVHARRDHGKLIFIDLRDRSGMVQVVFIPAMASGEASELRLEYVVQITGLVKKRPPNMVNDTPNGAYEIEAKSLKILSRAEALPIPVDTDGYEIDEEARMKYRYLDLRRERLAKNLRLRDKMTMVTREYLHENGFVEIETPMLTKSSPEGARAFMVPSRLQAGKFYALPQSPQQYKQLLMVGGLEKYFQIARCFCDEDTRGDRQPEFTQLDLEMSFVEGEDVMNLNEELLIKIVEAIYPNKKIQE